MTLSRLFLIGVGLLLFYLMFLKPGNLLFRFTAHIAAGYGELAGRILGILRALLCGYCAYALTAMLLSFSRIRTFGDIWVLLCTRPSRLGGAGFFGVVVGITFAGWAYTAANQELPFLSWFLRGRQVNEPQNPQTPESPNCLDEAARIRDLNKQENRKK